MFRCAVTGALLVLALAWAAPAVADEPNLLDSFNATVRVRGLADHRLGDVSIMLLTLRETSDVKSLDWDTMLPVLATLQAHLPESLVWFALPDGSYYTIEGGLMEQSLADRDYFPRLLAGEEVLGDVVVGKSSGKRSVIIAEPVYHDGQVAGVLGVSLFLDRLIEQLEEDAQWPDDAGLRILDATGMELATLGHATAPQGEDLLTSRLSGWQYQLLMDGLATYGPSDQ